MDAPLRELAEEQPDGTWTDAAMLADDVATANDHAEANAIAEAEGVDEATRRAWYPLAFRSP